MSNHHLQTQSRARVNRSIPGDSDGEQLRFRASWQRCAEQYHLSPSDQPDIEMLRRAEINLLREQFGHDEYLYSLDELNELMFSVSDFGYSASLANQRGVIIAESVAGSQTWHCESEKIGSVWIEKIGGTNGIGTALAEERAVAIYQHDHFFHDYQHQACAAAPFYSPLGHMAGVINLTTRNPAIDVMTHHLVTRLALKGSVHLEERMFRRHFKDYFLVRLQAFSSHPLLLAVDRGGFIFGASHGIREMLDLQDNDFGIKRLHDFFDEKAVASQLARGQHHTEWFFNQNESSVSVNLHEPLASNPVFAMSNEQTNTPRTTRDSAVSISNSPLDLCAGSDLTMKKNVQLIRKVVDKHLPILLLGETGVGKDTLAKAIHHESKRRNKNFVAFNCASVPESLIDSELFGYSRGAFTGATKEGNSGRLVEADGGTLFLDEIGDMPLALQTRLLRVLETGEVSPLGAGKTRLVDIEIVAATNQKLQQRVAEGTFREDLFYRLSGIIVSVPPLRERSDISHLIDIFIAEFSAEKTVQLDGIARQQLINHDWPGNIRELRHVLRRAVLLCENQLISASDLFLPAKVHPVSQIAHSNYHAPDGESTHPVKSALANAEIEAIQKALLQTQGNVALAATQLGMAKATLYRRLKHYKLS